MKIPDNCIEGLCRMLADNSRQGFGPEVEIRAFDFPLPFECDTASYFMLEYSSSLVTQVGYITKQESGYQLHTSGYEYECLGDGLRLFERIEKALRCTITKFEWLCSNPLDLPEWNPILEPPECKIYRFQYYQNGSWKDGSYRKSPNENSWNTSQTIDWHKNISFAWDTLVSALGEIERFVWVDECPGLGPWPGNKSESESKPVTSLAREASDPPRCNDDIMITLSNGEIVKGWYARPTGRYQRYLKYGEVVSWRELYEDEKRQA